MKEWFEIDSTDVIEIIEKRKDCFPWGNYPEEKYRCLIYWKDGSIFMTVDEFYQEDDNTYLCCIYYTSKISRTIEEYKGMTEEAFVEKAYNTWMTGAR